MLLYGPTLMLVSATTSLSILVSLVLLIAGLSLQKPHLYWISLGAMVLVSAQMGLLMYLLEICDCCQTQSEVDVATPKKDEPDIAV